jgi:alpha-glucoside transport system substrate-binding protein
MTRQRRRTRRALVLLAPLVVVASACANNSSDNAGNTGGTTDLKGKKVTIFGPEVTDEAQALKAAFKPLEERTGMTVEVTGDRSFEQQIGVRIQGGNPPDIAMFPQPGKVNDFKDDVKPLPDDLITTAKANFEAGYLDPVTIDGKIRAIPAKADLKSLVWYSPAAFKAAGYTIPTTWDDYNKLVDKIIADGKNAFCVGLGSDAATGWPYTDWVEDYMLRLKGADFYDKWVKHEIPFNDPGVIEVGQTIDTLWKKQGGVYGGAKNAVATPFADAGAPLLKGDCVLHRQGNFYAGEWPDGTKLGKDGDVDAFFLPGSTKDPKITLTGGIYATPLADRPEVTEVLRYIASPEFGNTRATVTSGALSPNKKADPSKYRTPLEQDFVRILSSATPVRFDASDMMPGEVGAKSFWSAAVDIANGDKTVQQAYTDVEATWPKK